MRGFRFGLARRGLAMLMFGGLIATGASLIGEPDLTRAGVFVTCLPVVGLVVMLALPPRLTCEHSVVPNSLPVGKMAWVWLSAASNRTASLSALDFRDRLPGTLGWNTTFELIRSLGYWRQATGYDMAIRQRGHFQIDPLRVRNLGAFGVAQRSWQAIGDITSLCVTSRSWTLSLPKGERTSGADGDAIPQRIGSTGTDDVLVHEHRYGGGMHRVHQKVSAKRGELMVRSEERPWDLAITIIADARMAAHIGSGPESTLEWVLSLGVLLAIELFRDRLRVSLLSTDGAIFHPVNGEFTGAAAHLLTTAADAKLPGRALLGNCLTNPDVLGAARTVVAGFGLLHFHDVAVLVTTTARVTGIDALVPSARAFCPPADMVIAHEETYRLLITSGWSVATFGPEATVPQGWGRLIAQREVR